mgnify:CR=1 FL=1
MALTALVFFLTTLLGGAPYVLLGQSGMKYLPIVLSFGGAFVLGMSFLHLVPDAFTTSNYAGLFVLVGFFVQINLEMLSKGVEHGHVHAHLHDERCQDTFTWKRLPWAILLGLSLHAALESMPVVHHNHDHHGHAHGPLSMHSIDWRLAIGLVLHKVPVAMVLMAMMLEQHTPKRLAWLALGLFGLAPLAGMALNSAVANNLSFNQVAEFNACLQALVVGILLHVGTTVLFEAGDGHRFHTKKFAATLVGLVLSALVFI